ncbi:MAG: metallophosphoesterase [Clostridia bacterium]|nr:metallophosphoesterase [Clostridia bacterium]
MKKQSVRPASQRRFRQWGLCISVALPAILLGWWLVWSNCALEITPITVPVKGLPASFEGLKIAHVSDLHARRFGKEQADLLDAIAQEKPDLIAVTGDIIDAETKDFTPVKEFVEGALKIAPVYYVMGNHEPDNPAYPELFEYLQSAGVVLLFDTYEVLARDGETLTLMGLSDRKLPSVQDEAEMLRRLRALSEETEGCKILFSHRPELIESVYAGKANLVLAGHAHGGQIRLPWIGGLYAPGQGLFPQYTAGLYTVEDTPMVVSRGLGLPYPRINNRPQVLILTLAADD